MGRLELQEMVGTRILASCQTFCPKDRIIGTGIYSPRSSVCASAYHAGVIAGSLYKFYIIIQKG